MAAFATLMVACGCATAPSLEKPATGEYLSARLAARLNNVEAAATSFDGARLATPGNLELTRRTYFYQLAAGDVENALATARALVVSDEAKPEGMPLLVLALQALKEGNLPAAQELLEGPFNEPFIKSVANLTNVWIEAGLEGPAAGIKRLDASGEDVFKGFNATHKAFLAEKAGDTDIARQAFQVSALGFGGPIARQAFGAFLERSGDLAAAREYYTLLANERGPSRRLSTAALKRLDQLEAGRGAPSDAYEDITPQTGAAIALHAFASALLQQSAGERERAEAAGFNVGEPRYNLPLAFAQLALYLKPDLAEARRLVGGILNIYEDFEGAEKVLAAIPPSSPHYEQAQIDIARGYAIAEREAQAIRKLKSAVKRVDAPYEAQYFLATLYAVEERREEAAAVITDALAAIGDNPPDDVWRYYILRGSAYLDEKNWDGAEADFKKAYSLAPEEPTTLNHLGYSWAERGVNLEEAFDLIEKALALNPKDAAITDSLGWAYYKLGQYEEAVGHLEEAATLAPEDPTITDHLGDVYWRLGREREATYQWRRALELEPSSDTVEIIESKLQDGLADPASDAPEGGDAVDALTDAAADAKS